MKQARYKEPLPLAVIEAARAGDAGAVEQVLQYYNGYINKLCTRTLYDDCGQLHVCVDEYMKHRFENKLISFTCVRVSIRVDKSHSLLQFSPSTSLLCPLPVLCRLLPKTSCCKKSSAYQNRKSEGLRLPMHFHCTGAYRR